MGGLNYLMKVHPCWRAPPTDITTVGVSRVTSALNTTPRRGWLHRMTTGGAPSNPEKGGSKLMKR